MKEDIEMDRVTWRHFDNGLNKYRDVANLMDLVGEVTGKFPNWDDDIPKTVYLILKLK